VRVGIGWNPFDPEGIASPRFLASVELIESLGYDSFWLPDTATIRGPAPLPALAAVATRTERLVLGTAVLVGPARPPALLAKELATVDALSHGRLLAGIGVGVESPAELAALGVSERGARFEEAIEVVRRLWSGDRVTYHGRFTTLENVRLSPPPANPELQLWLTGSSPRSLRRTGRLGDGWLGSFVSASAFPAQREAIRAAAAEAGRSLGDDRFGVVLWAVASAEDGDVLLRALPQVHVERLERPDDVVGIGADGVRALLERFRDAGVARVVLMATHRDYDAFLRELREEAVAAVVRSAYDSTRVGDPHAKTGTN
jgi:probable F420-dependent oxidoreductase